MVHQLPEVDLAYLDPPYNQHRYFTNYHIWETLVAWDAPAHYGVACKRINERDDATKSVFNATRAMPAALAATVAGVRAEVVVLSYNDESWVSLDDLVAMCAERGHVRVLAFDSKRYVGAQIGIHSPTGAKVGQVFAPPATPSTSWWPARRPGWRRNGRPGRRLDRRRPPRRGTTCAG